MGVSEETCSYLSLPMSIDSDYLVQATLKMLCGYFTIDRLGFNERSGSFQYSDNPQLNATLSYSHASLE